MVDELKYEWDEVKRQKNIIERGLDIAVLAPMLISGDHTIFMPDRRQDYGEERWLAFGLVKNLRLCVCFTLRLDVVRLITIYKVNKKDWENFYVKNN